MVIVRPGLLTPILFCVLLLLSPCADAQNLLYNGGLEDYDYGSLATGIDVTWPVTVSTASSDWNNMIGDWARSAAGDWDVAPLGTGNASSVCWTMRKGYGHVQILPADEVVSGDQLQLDWSYYVPSAFATEVTYEVKVFGVNVAGVGESDTTLTASDLSFGGESWNSALLFTSSVTIPAGTGDGVWHDAATALHTVAADWDYVGVWFKRPAGLYNDATQQMDHFSLQIVTVTNDPPVADAGSDQNVTDTDNSGYEMVTLDATGSSDSDGTIVSYVWTEGATQIATGSQSSVSLAVGTHTLTLTVTDDDSATDADTVVVTVNAYTPPQELLYNGGLEDYDYGSLATGIDVTWPVTVSTASSDWNNMIGDWARSAAGDWDVAPQGTGNASSVCWTMRKGYGHVQILPAGDVVSGDQLQLDWSYYVPSAFATEVTYEVKVFGVNVAGVGESDTTLTASDLSFGGESWNSAVLFASSVTIPAGTGDGVWHDAATALHTVAADWDYVGVWFKRPAGLYNDATQQMDHFSLKLIGSGVPVNAPPVADAGSDQSVTDTDNSGYEMVTLDATGSSDSDGTIVSYVWTEGATQIATGSQPSVSLAVGTHTLTLTVTDDDSATDADAVVVTVYAASSPDGDYFIDFDGGNDAWDGTTPATAWKHCPGDANATGVAASTSLSIGDVVVFKGGVKYRGQVVCAYSGVTYDGNTAGNFGTGAAIMDGSETLGGWTQCTSAAEAGGNPNWANIWYAYAPADTTLNTANIYQYDASNQTDNLCPIAQDPNQAEAFWMDNVAYFHDYPLVNSTRTSLTDPVRLTQTDPNYWDGAYLMIWVVPNMVNARSIDSFDPATDTITFSTTTNDPYGSPEGRYAIYNHISLIDQGGEYYFNETPEVDGTHKVWFWPIVGNPNANPVSISVPSERHSAFVLTAGVSHVAFDGIKMQKYSGGGSFGSRYGGAGVNGNAVTSLSHITVRNCEFFGIRHDYTDMYGYGALTLKGSDHLIEDNVFVELPVTNAMQFVVSDTVIQGNYIERPGRHGMWSKFNDCIIQDNTLIDVLGTHGNGIAAFQASTNVVIRRNVILNSGVPICTGDPGTDNITVAYNLLHCPNSYAFADYDGETTNLRIHNNTLIRDNDKPSWRNDSNGEMRNNIMYDFVNNTSLTPDANGNLRIRHTMDADVFVDAANFDFHLVTGSPAIDAAANLGYTGDVEGTAVPQNGTPDIGAYEYAP